MTTSSRSRVLAVAVVLLAAAGALSLVPGASAAPRQPVKIQLLNVSDWHAQLDPISGVGGAAVLSSYWNAERAANPNTLTLTAGDAFGASPPLSNYFNEEPAVRAMNLMGFDADTLGNHNFDRGIGHLQQMIDLAEFEYVSANLKNVEDNLSGVAPFAMFQVGGLDVAVVGITNPEAPTLVKPGNFGTIEVTEPAPAANKARAAARRAGAEIVVAITHLGVTGTDPESGSAVGPLIDFANDVGGFDVIFGDHTDVQFSSIINNALVVENRSKGIRYARTTLSMDPGNGRVLSRDVQFVTPTANAVTPDQAIVDMLQPYREELAEVFDGVIGVATDVFPRGGNVERLQEVAIGNLITDAMRLRYGAQLAVTNGGGIRAPLPSSYAPEDTTLRRTTPGYAAGPPYDLVLGDAFTVLPFGNVVVTRTVTGAQLHAMLEHSVAPIPSANGRFAQISGFRFTYDAALPAGSRVVSVALDDGTPILPDGTTYTLATNDFMNTGGDGYTMLADGQGVSREVMADVVAEYIEEQGTITPTIEGRITRLN
ncbi:MAG TPA: 5'-nucleotidase C-terminal domain-containing protein [Actinomycetota bacterium]|nr:5'-nucleotidase C-terminal domain-containing protein [Actinomycetota bacterium]